MRGPPGWWWLVVHPTGEGIACQARHGVDACSTNSLPRKRLRKPLLLSPSVGEGWVGGYHGNGRLRWPATQALALPAGRAPEPIGFRSCTSPRSLAPPDSGSGIALRR